jgi:hypothetical protein
MFLEPRLERLIEKLGQSAAISLRVERWNGRAFDLASLPAARPLAKVSGADREASGNRHQ